MANELHVFTMDKTDSVVARDADHAWEVYACALGYSTVEELKDDVGNEPFEIVPDDKPMRICIDDDGERTDDASRVLMLTAAEWCVREGEGFLCSTEY